MGLLVDGKWKDKWYDTDGNNGKFERSAAQFRNWLTPDGGPGPQGQKGFAAEKNRYHLYVSYACPWAHRALIYRTLFGLEDFIDVSYTDWFMGENGWTFNGEDDFVGDKLYGVEKFYEIYLKADPKYSGRVTVPVLWDKQEETIVSNESADIIRMFNSAFQNLEADTPDLYPENKRDKIDELNKRIYETVNNGVYKAGFATKQDAYEDALYPLFETLDDMEGLLSNQRFLCGDLVTEADWRFFTTLFRFDAVYHGHFKCNVRKISEYENLWAYTRDLFQQPGIAATTNLHHVKHHYYVSHDMVNPTQIVPVGPDTDFNAPHNRDQIDSKTLPAK